MLEDEVCTRTCIEELQVATLELLMGSFREGGLRLSAPPCPINLCPNPPRAACPVRRPGGQILFHLAGDGASPPPSTALAPASCPPDHGARGGGAWRLCHHL